MYNNLLSVLLFFAWSSSSAISAPSLEPSITSLEEFEIEDSAARIVNGYQIDISKIPYQAALRRRVTSGWSHTCGAVIISHTAVLTAAHCVDSYVSEPSSLRVAVGMSSLLFGGKTYDVAKVIIHSTYSSMTLVDDIALLGTTKIMSFSTNINSVAIASATHSLPVGTEALVSGFGTTSYEGSTSSTLLAAKVYIIDQAVCSRAYVRIASIYSGMVCANASNPYRDACQGDSGGPLVADGILVGIVSWGERCADPLYPGVYTRVSEYNSWILTNLIQLS
ncbi:hypothetical protein K1T71_005633 [Dendrolimus kikuchii]|uniref:Uncharacterized protein n=1 Tax=Dendrolimus kikuchii TaxID=765133 RepID=A0ACC1D5I7_9NEOP|nr:hypothetical protein K1T71_005633 [Dendrolimus kikuchii]